MAFTKINVGRPITGVNRASTFNKSCNSSYSANFGRVIPTYFDLVNGKSVINVNGVNSIVRVASLNVPTFGDMRLKTYYNFVRIHDIFDPYEALKTGNIYRYAVSQTSAAVTSLPKLALYKLYQGLNAGVQTVNNTLELSDSTYYGSNLLIEQNGSTVDVSQYGSIISALKTHLNTNGVNLYHFFDTYGHFSYTNVGYEHYISLQDHTSIINGVSLESRTRLYRASKTTHDVKRVVSLTISGTTKQYEFYYRWGMIDRRLHEILIGLTYPSCCADIDVNFLPLLAFYKAWYECFSPNRRNNWQNTNAYGIITQLRSNVSGLSDSFLSSGTFPSFMYEVVVDTNYYFAPDYFTTQLDPNGNELGQTASNNHEPESIYDRTNKATITGMNKDAIPTTRDGVAYQSALVNRILDRMLRFANVNSVVGRSIVEYCKAHGLSVPKDCIEKSCFGADHVSLQVSSVLSNAETEAAQIGDFRGFAIGSGKGKSYHYETDDDGYFICFSVLVPNLGYYQGCSSHVLNYSKFESIYFPEFDSLGLTPTNGLEFNSDYNTAKSVAHTDFNVAIGMRPRYTDFKVKNNQLNGCLRFLSDSAQFSGYTLDRNFGTDGKLYNLASDSIRSLRYSYDLFNLHRIFNDTNWLSDVFFVHQTYNVSVRSNMIPIEQSYTNQEQDSSDNYVEMA